MSETRVLGLLRGLCNGLSPGGIVVVADDEHTAFMPHRRKILVARRFLSADTPVAIGALLHEIGHALVTRYHLFAGPEDIRQALWWQALNAVEETRVHCFLRRRLPGVGGYLDALFAMDEPPESEAFESDLLVFLAATATWDRHPSLPFLAGFPAAMAAFHRTEPARLRYMRALPPPDLVPLPNLNARYASVVAPALDPTASEVGKSEDVVPLEAEVRCAAASALEIFVEAIWPEITALAGRDHARIARLVSDNLDLRIAVTSDEAMAVYGRAALVRQAMRAWIAAHGTEVAPDPPTDELLTKLAWDLLREYLEAESRNPQQLASVSRIPTKLRTGQMPAKHALFADDVSEEPELPSPEGSDIGDEQARRALVDVLRRAVPRRPIQRTSGHRSGIAIDLDRAIRAAATGRGSDRIWLRRTEELPVLAALLLVDLSGSMSGPKVMAAIAATRALSSALAEVRGIAWCVLGFQDKTIPFVRFEERADPHVLARIDDMRAEVVGKRAGGNNQPRYNDDGPCLLEAAAVLQARPVQDRLLIVISDGNPEGRRSGRDDLHRAVAQVQAMKGMTLVGLGLGPSTDHVTRYYPVSQANIALGDLAPAIGRLLASGARGFSAAPT
jgi:VWA domain containing CoxE-like protein